MNEQGGNYRVAARFHYDHGWRPFPGETTPYDLTLYARADVGVPPPACAAGTDD